MPKDWQMVKCLSYPGTGQRNFTLSSLLQGASECRSPWVNAFEMRPYISVRLALPAAKTCSGFTPSMSAKSARQAGRPSIVP